MRDGADAMALATLLRSQHVLSEEDVSSTRVPMAALIGANDYRFWEVGLPSSAR